MDIVDAHHHIWLRDEVPWLVGPMQPRIFGSYEPIRRDYLLEEYLDDLAGTGVVKSVYVQANWADPEREVAWIQRTAEESGWPHAIVAYADFLADDVRPALDRLMRLPLLRGVRIQLHWHEKELFRFAGRPDLADDPTLRRNVARLADYRLSCDIQVFAGQMDGAARLAADFPQVRFILQHGGMPEDLSEEGMAAWRAGMRTVAALPNAFVKLSGLGTFVHRNDPVHIASIVDECVAIFGSSRSLFGSNFPIEKIWTAYKPLIDAYRAALAKYSEAERADMFFNVASRVYRLG